MTYVMMFEERNKRKKRKKVAFHVSTTLTFPFKKVKFFHCPPAHQNMKESFFLVRQLLGS